MAIFGSGNFSGSENWFSDRIADTSSRIASQIGIENPLGLVLLIVVIFVAFAGARVFTFERSLLAASFLGLVISIMLVAIGWLSSGFIYLMGIVFVVALLIVFISRNN